MAQYKQCTTTSLRQTQKIAKDVVSDLKKGSIIALYGDLGSGKTTFTQGIAKTLGIERNIQSPTFILMRQYNVDNNSVQTLYHLDLYRLESYEHDELGLKEIFDDPHALVVIEWADRMGELLPKKRIDIHFEYIDEEKRKITIEYC